MSTLPKFACVVALGLSSLSVSPSSVAQPVEQSLTNVCLQSFPDHITARLEARQRRFARLISNNASVVAPNYVLKNLSRWRQNQVIKVAFRGGTYQLRRQIMNTALKWTPHINLKFDFGHDEATQQFNEWKTTDTQFSGDIRIAFDAVGNWSLVGNDSTDPLIVAPGQTSMNLGGFDIKLPAQWQGTVLHEFGHALGFEHEHQHPTGGCDGEFRWYDDPGYVYTADQFGQVVVDANGRRPGLYNLLGGAPNNWPKWKVDHNLKQLGDSHAFSTSEFDRASIMKYHFEPWMFINGSQSYCYTGIRNDHLSELDKRGASTAYPQQAAAAIAKTRIQEEQLSTFLRTIRNLPASAGGVLTKRLEALQKK